eukprot:715246-Prymnesium_polylepis.1
MIDTTRFFGFGVCGRCTGLAMAADAAPPPLELPSERASSASLGQPSSAGQPSLSSAKSAPSAQLANERRKTCFRLGAAGSSSAGALVAGASAADEEAAAPPKRPSTGDDKKQRRKTGLFGKINLDEEDESEEERTNRKLMSLLGVQPPGSKSQLSGTPMLQVREMRKTTLFKRGVESVRADLSHTRASASAVALGWVLGKSPVVAEDHRAPFRRILEKEPEERTTVEQIYLQDWARRIRFADAEVSAHIKMDLLVQVMRLVPPSDDSVVCVQGDEGDNFYIVFSGSVSCYLVTSGKTRAPMPTDREPLAIELQQDEDDRAEMKAALVCTRAAHAHTLPTEAQTRRARPPGAAGAGPRRPSRRGAPALPALLTRA